MLKIGIIGVGNMGSAHVVSIGQLSNAKLTAICDINPEKLKKYDPEKLHYGYNTVDSEEIYYIPNPALGLWINREKFEG